MVMVSNTPGIYPVMGLKAYGELQRKAEQNIRYANGIQSDTKQSLGDIAKDSIIYGGLGGGAFAGIPWLVSNRKNLKGAIAKINSLPANKLEFTVDSFMRQGSDAKARKLMLDAEKLGEKGTKVADLAKESINTTDKAVRTEHLTQAQKEYAQITKTTKKVALSNIPRLKAEYKAAQAAALNNPIPETKKALQEAKEALSKARSEAGYISRVKNWTGAKIGSVMPGSVKNFYAGSKSAFAEKIAKPAGEFLAKHPTLAKGVNLCKGAGAMFMGIVEGGIEMFTEVVPAFKMDGLTGGIKQIFKSGTKVAASVGGWIAGEAAGSAAGAGIGAAIGGTIGTVFGPLGTALGIKIGGIVGTVLGGFIGGFFASSAAKEIASSVVGKSVREQIVDEEIHRQSLQIISDNTARIQLNMLTNQRLAQQLQAGEITEDEFRKKQFELAM